MSGLFGKLQLVSAAAYSLGHGGNDAQKTMGIIFAVLIARRMSREGRPTCRPWVVLACHAAMGLGTLMGGWRIVKTMGQKICKLQPVHGFAAETGGALCLFGATALGIPVSHDAHDHGRDRRRRLDARRARREVGRRRRVVWAWVLTIPASALVGAATWWIFRALGWR